ncbi:hypothetical protein [Flavipsychrobacter stenotrophus]|uniref:hypothetical protein n=1 Tax=Flavipsychrobacter stenotrophus TaxID=2077091 RepID=UPI000CF37458|nr:hypothetical protein [Flavipsychrobacter stenotrophus]
MRKLLTKMGMGLMLIVFLVGSTPPEYIHDLFANHQDEIDAPIVKGQAVMTPEHHHCSFLGFEFTPFVTTPHELLVFEFITHENTWRPSFYYFNCSTGHQAVSLRGPPAFVC